MLTDPAITLGVVVDHDLTVRDVTRVAVVPRRYEVETVTTRTDWAGDARTSSSWHHETQHHVVRTTLSELANVAVCRMPDGSRRSFVSDDVRLVRGEPVLFVHHRALWFHADDVLRVFDRRWMTEIRVPDAGNVPLLSALLVALLSAMLRSPDIRSLEAGAVTFLALHAASRVLGFLRTRLLIASRRKAAREARRISDEVA